MSNEIPKYVVDNTPEQTYPLKEILANAEALFGHRAEVVQGALYDNTKKELTVSEVRQAINFFLKRRAK